MPVSLTCSDDPREKPFDGDVLIEGGRIAKVVAGRLEVDPADRPRADPGAAD